MFYGTGGFAYGGGSAHANFFDFNNSFGWGGSTSPSRAGWTLGAGVEYAITNNIILGAEYLYYDLGSHTNDACGDRPFEHATSAGRIRQREADIDGSIVRARLSYKF